MPDTQAHYPNQVNTPRWGHNIVHQRLVIADLSAVLVHDPDHWNKVRVAEVMRWTTASWTEHRDVLALLAMDARVLDSHWLVNPSCHGAWSQFNPGGDSAGLALSMDLVLHHDPAGPETSYPVHFGYKPRPDTHQVHLFAGDFVGTDRPGAQRARALAHLGLVSACGILLDVRPDNLDHLLGTGALVSTDDGPDEVVVIRPAVDDDPLVFPKLKATAFMLRQ